MPWSLYLQERASSTHWTEIWFARGVEEKNHYSWRESNLAVQPLPITLLNEIYRKYRNVFLQNITQCLTYTQHAAIEPIPLIMSTDFCRTDRMQHRLFMSWLCLKDRNVFSNEEAPIYIILVDKKFEKIRRMIKAVKHVLVFLWFCQLFTGKNYVIPQNEVIW